MLNGVNNYNDKQLIGGSYSSRDVSGVTNPISSHNPYTKFDEGLLIDESALSRAAFDMYQREIDIKNFSQYVMSDVEDNSHISKVENLFKEGVVDPFKFDDMEILANNDKLLEDLGF